MFISDLWLALWKQNSLTFSLLHFKVQEKKLGLLSDCPPLHIIFKTGGPHFTIQHTGFLFSFAFFALFVLCF